MRFHPDREDQMVRAESMAVDGLAVDGTAVDGPAVDQPLAWETAVALGLAAKAQRLRLGLTQAEVALVAGVGVRFIGELEAGKPTLQLERVVRVVRALGGQLQLVWP